MNETQARRRPGLYLRIWGLLLGLTLVMVLLDRAALPWAVLVAVLVAAMLTKASLIAAYFMHLRFDSRMFRRMFLAGLVLAILVYMAFLTAMQLFGDDTTSEHPAQGPPPAVTA